MKIKSLKIINNSILGDIKMSFCDPNDNPLDTIIFVGENGCGKSALLNVIHSVARLRPDPRTHAEERFFKIQLEDREVKQLITKGVIVVPQIYKNEINIHFDFNIGNNWNQIKITYQGSPGSTISIKSNHPDLHAIFRSIFSDVEINFTPANVAAVTASDVDKTGNGSFKSSAAISTEIKQLLVDVSALDDADLATWVRTHPGQSPPGDALDRRIRRFQSAYKYMFPNKAFSGIENIGGGKSVMFTEFGKKISVEDLSSGEKQIVFRGGFLLKDQKMNFGAIVAIDEPEISLHPTWQLKILDFYKNLIKASDGTQIAQLFVATHSPFVVDNDNRYNDKVIILSKDAVGKIIVNDQLDFFGWTRQRIIVEALHVDINATAIKQTTKPVVYVEGITDEIYWAKALELFGYQKFDVKFIGKITKQGDEFSGDRSLNQTGQYLTAHPEVLQHHVMLLYDPEKNKPESNEGKVLIRCIPPNQSNSQYQIGVENLLNLPSDFKPESFYDLSELKDKYGARRRIETLNKRRLAEWAVSLPVDQLKNILGLFEPVLKQIDQDFQKA